MTGIEVAALALAVVGTAVSAVGSIRAGEAQQNIANYNAEVDAENARQAQMAAQAQAQLTDQKNRQRYGQAEAAYGAAGVDVTGSPLTVISGLAATGELNRQMVLWQGKTQSNALTSAGTLSTAQGDAAASAGQIQAGASLLTGTSNALLTYNKGATASSPTTPTPAQQYAAGKSPI